MKTAQPFWKHWNLRKNPFGAVETENDVFESAEAVRIMEMLAEAVEEGGIYSVTGERGIGKTTVKNEIIHYFERYRERFAYCRIECMDMNELTMARILSALVIELSSETPRAQVERRKRQVRRILGELAERKRVVLIIDEAQKISIRTMEALKMITEMTWGFRTRLISVILFGQPELTSRLSRDEGLFLRVTQYQMRGLNQDEVLQYIDLRCRAAGGEMRDIFEPDALTYIAENQHSPLHINFVGSSTMRMARRAGEKKVTLGMIYESGGIRSPRQVIRDNNLSVKRFARLCHIDHKVLVDMLDGDMEGTTPEQRERFRAGLSNVARGKQEDVPFSRSPKAQEAV